MKFLMVVLAIRFVAGLMTSRKDNAMINDAGEKRNEKIFHPAEYNLR
jgi:hypothetical protein